MRANNSLAANSGGLSNRGSRSNGLLASKWSALQASNLVSKHMELWEASK